MHPAGDSGTGDMPRWSSAGRGEARRGFPFGGIRAAPALARFPGRCPGSLVARLRTLFRKASERQIRQRAVLGVQQVLKNKERALPFPSPPTASGR
ncbi:hypothetical protein NDU88_002260 [Pleurodeles waltl]|uniref:Uncharacterized protein n=1 Tax=Pleurodeles waltl TaxID=8319 RepID=A0AAV7VCR0_PLEWA|nr:hypothetical protein NDU88_002260 [Pleurodeles waltl]